MIDIKFEKWRLQWIGDCYMISKLGIAGERSKNKGEEQKGSRSYHSTLENAINELIFKCKLPDEKVRTLEELVKVIEAIKDDIRKLFRFTMKEEI